MLDDTKPEQTAVNDSRTSSAFDANLTRAGSLDVLRRKHGATSAIGYACSNLMEMRNALPPAADERIDYLTPDHVIEIEARLLMAAKREEARLQRLLAQPN